MTLVDDLIAQGKDPLDALVINVTKEMQDAENDKVLKKWIDRLPDGASDRLRFWIERRIAIAIDEARREERERCAKIVDGEQGQAIWQLPVADSDCLDCVVNCSIIAAAIRTAEGEKNRSSHEQDDD